MLTIALSHVLGLGVRLQAHEAVALARELLGHSCGTPTLENIQLGFDGSASCIHRDGTPSVTSVADLLVRLLPPGTPNVPAPLRYTIARGLEVVEAPPFKSPGEFATVLQRFEKGASRDVLRGVLQRGVRSSPSLAPLAAPPLMFRSFVADSDAGAPAHSWRWWALVAAAALAASFALGFGVMDRIVDRHAATTSGRSARVPGVSSASPAPGDPAANPPHAEVSDEIVRVPPAAVRGASRTIGMGRHRRPRGSPTTVASPKTTTRR